MEAGALELISPSRHALTAAAFRASGTTATISSAFKICRIDMEMARVGTSAMDEYQPSFTCWRRQASSSSTTRYGSSVSKSAGGSLNARCPFSPIPTNARFTGSLLNSPPTSRITSPEFRSPSSKWCRVIPVFRISRSNKYLRKLAACVIGNPTYSSKWNNSTRRQSMPEALVSPSKNSNCEAPVAAISRAQSRLARILLSDSAACFAAAAPTSCLSPSIFTSNFRPLSSLFNPHSLSQSARFVNFFH